MAAEIELDPFRMAGKMSEKVRWEDIPVGAWFRTGVETCNELSRVKTGPEEVTYSKQKGSSTYKLPRLKQFVVDEQFQYDLDSVPAPWPLAVPDELDTELATAERRLKALSDYVDLLKRCRAAKELTR